jgi:hypothetical protein
MMSVMSAPSLPRFNSPVSAGIGFRALVRRLDAVLRRRHGIFEFTADRDCVFRLSIEPAHAAIVLSDGAAIAAGAPIAELHYWNEQMPRIPESGADAVWASLFLGRLRRSFALMARALDRDPRLADVVAIHGAPPFALAFGGRGVTQVCRRLGFDIGEPERGGPLRRIRDFFDGVLVWGLISTFNPVGLRHKGLRHGRIQIWISRARMIETHGGN